MKLWELVRFLNSGLGSCADELRDTNLCAVRMNRSGTLELAVKEERLVRRDIAASPKLWLNKLYFVVKVFTTFSSRFLRDK
jgi:hypothetical protein